MWLLDSLQRIEKIIVKGLLNVGIKKLWLKFDLGLALIDLQTSQT